MSVVRPPGNDGDVPAFCQMLEVPGLADVHVHFLPPRLLRRVEQVAGLVRLGMGEPWLRAVCWGNAARLFGLTADGS